MSSTTSLSRPFGIGTRTEIRLGVQHLVALSVRAGDLLRSEDGLVWATVDGEARDILLDRGDVHVVERDATLRVSAFGPARLEIYGEGPLRFEWPQHVPARAATARARDAMAAVLRAVRLPARTRLGPVRTA